VTHIVEMFGGTPCVSIELWPPRTDDAAIKLSATLDRLEDLRPAFASITYGAAGSTRDRTHDLVVSLQRDRHTTAMAHLACAAHSRAELEAILARYLDAGVTNVLALRGDPPVDATGPLPDGDLRRAVELVELVRQTGPFCIAVAAHPVGHPDAPDLASDRRFLADKLRVADFAITQFFYDIDDYRRLVDDLDALGVAKPVVPGVMPITSAKTLDRMTELSGVAVPQALRDRVESAKDASEVSRIGVDMATELCEQLVADGAPGLHFYTMNRFKATLEICTALGLSPGGRDADVGP